jgi:DNA-binding CsgD family transcriptional regulator
MRSSVASADGPGLHPLPAPDDAHIETPPVLGEQVLPGRRSECKTLDSLLARARAGRSGALVVRGEPGVGKTSLLEYVRERASGCRVARAAGIPSEMELAFAGLHQLCGPVLDRLERLPDPQRDALSRAFALTAGEPSDRFLVSLAAMSLLSDVAAEQPLVCLVDDAQWLDRASAQVLAFVARRLVAEPVVFVFAAREPAGELAGLPELLVEGLRDGDARDLLGSVIAGPLDERVRDRIVAEARGNPSALLESPRGLSPAKLAGGFGLPGAPAAAGPIEEDFRQQLEGLPAETRRLLLIAAAEPLGEPVLVWRAAARIGIESRFEAAAPATAAGLCEFDTGVRFLHPLVRSAVYRAASPEDRRTAHRALAEATDGEIDPDRRAWHRAQAAPGPDEEVAEELERSAGRAQPRGGLAAAAAFLVRATELTPDLGRRAERALVAAQAKYEAGEPDAAPRLLVAAQAAPLDELQRARVDLLRAQVAALRRGSDAPPLLLEAARRLEPLDVRLAREAYLELLSAALFAAPLADDGGVLEAAQAARAAPRPPGAPRAADLLLDGLAVLITDGYDAGTPILRRALRAFQGEDTPNEEGIRWLCLACRTAMDVWDDESWQALSARFVDVVRDVGALAVLPGALSSRTGVLVLAGELAAAEALVEELATVTMATGSQPAPYAALGLAAFRGREGEASELIEAGMREVARRGEGRGVTFMQWAPAGLKNGLGRFVPAPAAAEEASAHPHDPTRALPELIEAAARSGMPERAAGAMRRLSEATRAGGTDWGLGIEACSRALLSEGDAAEALYREAIQRLGRTRVRVALARAHLVYGEWLRRQNRRRDAREQLRTAQRMLTAMGAEGFAQRAARELVATGETARKRTIETSSQLTGREAQIARLARDGLSNMEIAARLFLSPRTVEYHLTKIFAKLDISSRMQLESALPPDREDGAVAVPS